MLNCSGNSPTFTASTIVPKPLTYINYFYFDIETRLVTHLATFRLALGSHLATQNLKSPTLGSQRGLAGAAGVLESALKSNITSRFREKKL